MIVLFDKQFKDSNTIRCIKNHNVVTLCHSIIKVTKNLRDCNEHITDTNEAAEIDEADLRQLNFHHENVSWDDIKEIIKEMPWTELFKGKNNKECTEIFKYLIRINCFRKIPKKRNKNKTHIPKEIKKNY